MSAGNGIRGQLERDSAMIRARYAARIAPDWYRRLPALSILAGLIADLLIEQQFTWTFNWINPGGTITLIILHLQRWDFLFVLAFLIGIYSIHRLALVKETGEVKERVVLQALLSEVRSATSVFSVTGLRSLTRFPSLLRQRASTRHEPPAAKTVHGEPRAPKAAPTPEPPPPPSKAGNSDS